MTDHTINVGDEVRVQIKRYESIHRTPVVSVIAGKVVKADHAALGFYGWSQYKLDTGYWFSPQSDVILDHRAAEL